MRWVLLAGLVALGCGEPVPARRPDVLLVVIDTLRADYLGTYGFPLPTSPNLDRFADQAVVFERAIAASANTVPSHASLMTSRYVRQHSVGWVNGTTRLEGAVTLAERFHEAGYETGAFVSNFVLRRASGLDAGFDVYDDAFSSAEPNRPDYYERDAAATTARALAWLSERGAEPLFLFVHYQDPHGPYLPPAEWLPFGVGYVELPGQVRVEARIKTEDVDKLAIGMDLELVVEPYTTRGDKQVVAYFFQPVDELH
jgi:arylsulfatase A-like enzyme